MILDRILADTRGDLPQRKSDVPTSQLESACAEQTPPLDLLTALRAPGVGVIAECKRASPSKGPLNLALAPSEMALTYAQAGCAALSILTEPRYFRGSGQDLREARESLASAGCPRPLLRKDFIVDRYQLLEARAWGADAALLIVAALSDAELSELFAAAVGLGLTPLIEVHNAAELGRALALDPPLIGVNNRNLHDFGVSLKTTRALRPLIPEGIVVVSESGIHQPEQLRELADMGVDAALVGESLVTADDPAAQLRALREAGR